MIQELQLHKQEVAQQILALQLPAYRVEAGIIGSDAIPALRDTVESLMSSGETFYGWFEDGELAGAIAYKLEDGELDIHRLIVHPNHFRKGIGRRLLQYVMEEHSLVKKYIVATGSKNVPAIQLYLSEGFIEVGGFEPVPGLPITNLEKIVLAE